MKNILPLLLAAALGSAATYFIMDSKQASAPAAKAVKAAPASPAAIPLPNRRP